MAVSTTDAARHLCDYTGWSISNLQLQKLLYMADMNFVGTSSGRLLPEDFEAWDYGPVLPSLYHKCKAFGSKPIPNVFWGARDLNGSAEAQMLELAWDNLRSLSAGQLVEVTHAPDSAWIRKYSPGARNIKITTLDMVHEYERRSA